MLKNKISLLIHSCGAYSDLWDGQIKMLNKYWTDRDIKCYIVTDTNPYGYDYDGVNILCAGDGTEITERISAFLDECPTDYVFVTLDDYYLIDYVSNERIEYLVDYMKENELDYIRIFKLSSDGEYIEGADKLCKILLNEDKSKYYVNLYPGIWSKEFMRKTIRERLNAWQYEVSLTKIAKELNAKCAVDRENDYILLDVVRKGKILHKANRYFKKHPGIYTGNRKVISYWTELKLYIFTKGRKMLPKKLARKVKTILSKKGVKFYSGLD